LFYSQVKYDGMTFEVFFAGLESPFKTIQHYSIAHNCEQGRSQEQEAKVLHQHWPATNRTWCILFSCVYVVEVLRLKFCCACMDASGIHTDDYQHRRVCKHLRTDPRTYARAHTHTHTLSLSLTNAHTRAHTHTQSSQRTWCATQRRS